MAGNITLDNTYHQGGPGVGANAFRSCTDGAPFETYTQHPGWTLITIGDHR